MNVRENVRFWSVSERLQLDNLGELEEMVFTAMVRE